MSESIEAYLSSIDWTEKIISQGVEQNSRKWLLNDLAEYLSEEYDIPKDEMQEEFEELQKEFEHLMSEDGELYYFFSEIRNVSFEYQRYKSKIKQQSGF